MGSRVLAVSIGAKAARKGVGMSCVWGTATGRERRDFWTRACPVRCGAAAASLATDVFTLTKRVPMDACAELDGLTMLPMFESSLRLPASGLCKVQCEHAIYIFRRRRD